ncbi:isoleucine--tRNA ligase [Litorihabitans aurantiacus]|uniref:Isoleucine--tRNA ligase n=1 Tax=Litorihabitans aurantiacus TaxID=1930061 RepID=A0AA37XEU1_9MICO|nr:isoleucine--tRNA ligase [Litorihabitans aurantiacus]GMA31849.1 isoleucine--tRNA ligase [Litorihabitans aurantiacus]
MSHAHYPRHRADETGPVASPSIPSIEAEVLASWQAGDTFRRSVEARPAGEDGENEFVFYDGPPFANGLPHYGHLLTGYVKDVVPRYQTMRGRRVERRFGWDTHGLPAELEAERILGITDKSQIEEMGIEAFNAACRSSVLRYTDEWQTYVTRQARWVDFDHDYKTLDPTYMESVIWAFKQLHTKELAYEGFRVLPYCWHDQTPLSNHELRMDDDVYQMRQDPALTVGLRLGTGEYLLVWTTTPWTLPSHQAIAVNPDVDYVVVEAADGSPFATAQPGARVILAAARLGAYARELGQEPTVVETVRGSDLVGARYAPPFPYFADAATGGAPADNPAAFQVIAGDFVTTEDGTGLVHMAPAFGEDDMVACDAVGITPVVTVDDGGRFTAQVADYAGVQVFEANAAIIADLKSATGPLAGVPADRRAVVVRHETYDHSYPHCWRCRNPLIYKAVSSWFVRVTQIRERMVELNQEIAWTPEHIRDGQFGKWLAGARDWSISRNRYWGTPIPVWVSDDENYPRTDVYGSFEELARDFGDVPRNAEGEPDLHRPWIDRLTRPNPDDPTGRSTMRRIPDVLDVWFDSGSMPFAQVHYPHQNTDWFEHHFPGDFIVEYIGQTRGWFYLLHVLSTALFDRPAFRTAVSHGIVLGSDGRKMSKSLRNYPDVTEVLDRDGSDAMRWFLMASPILRGGNLVVTEEGIRAEVRGVLLPLWNAWYFFGLYAGTVNDGAGYLAQRVEPDRVIGLPAMDRYLLARTHDLAVAVTSAADAYDIAGACAHIRDHIDLLTNWYVRTQRQRFWDEDTDAYDTLWTALEALTRIMAPFAPLLTEEIWRGLTGGDSVHLTDWPVRAVHRETTGAIDPNAAFSSTLTITTYDVEPSLAPDTALVLAMDAVRAAVSTAHALRKAYRVRVRQPLRQLAVVTADPAALEAFAGLIASELNVKEVRIEDLASDAAARYGVSTKLTVNARAAGPRLGKGVQQVIRAAREGDWHEVEGEVYAGGVALVEGEYELSTVAAGTGDGELAVAVLPGGGFVVVDLALDDELRAEGWARDVIRAVQDARKAADLHVADRIALRLGVSEDHAGAADVHHETIARETLATRLDVEVVEDGAIPKDAPAAVTLTKVEVDA